MTGHVNRGLKANTSLCPASVSNGARLDMQLKHQVIQKVVWKLREYVHVGTLNMNLLRAAGELGKVEIWNYIE